MEEGVEEGGAACSAATTAVEAVVGWSLVRKLGWWGCVEGSDFDVDSWCRDLGLRSGWERGQPSLCYLRCWVALAQGRE